MKRKYITILSAIAILISCKPTSNNNFNLHRESYNNIIQRLSNQGNWREAVELINIQLQHSADSDNDENFYYLALGENYRFLEQYELAELNFRKVIENAKPNESSQFLGEAFYGLGDLYYLKWSYFKQEEALPESVIYLDSAMIYAKENEQLALESKILYRQGTIFQIQGQKEEGEKRFEKGLEIAFAVSDTMGIIRNDIHTAVDLERAGALDSALFHFTRANRYANAFNRKYSETHSLCNLGHFYLGRNEVLKSKDYFIQAKFLAEELQHRIIMARSYYGLSMIEEKLGNQEEAIKYANEGLALAREKGYKNFEQSFLRIIEGE